MNNYWMIALIATGILMAIALVLAVVILIAERFFKVQEDPRIAEVEKMLPNANCGNCGYAGCHDMAEALVTGEEKKVSKCRVGNADKNFKPIIHYLETHPGPDGKTNVPTL
jgi:electron transport complex protein RnfB